MLDDYSVLNHDELFYDGEQGCGGGLLDLRCSHVYSVLKHDNMFLTGDRAAVVCKRS
jgi:hypothetical protein